MSTSSGVRGFTRPNLFRMRKYYGANRDNEKVSPLARQLDEVERGDES